jgi:hypothetical protein
VPTCFRKEELERVRAVPGGFSAGEPHSCSVAVHTAIVHGGTAERDRPHGPFGRSRVAAFGRATRRPTGTGLVASSGYAFGDGGDWTEFRYRDWRRRVFKKVVKRAGLPELTRPYDPRQRLQ